MSIVIQTEAFDVAQETAQLTHVSRSVGAVVTFIGLVRDVNEGNEIHSLRLEHYPGMAEKAIARIIKEARERWVLEAVRVVHRVGSLKPTDLIVFVGVASLHRSDAFRACEFIMDYLKTQAPFWKKENSANGESWLEARDSDSESLEKWQRRVDEQNPIDFA